MRALIRSLLLVLAVLCMAPPAVAQTTPTTTPTTGIVAGATAIVASHTDVAAGAYVLRLSNVSPQNGSFVQSM